MPRIEEEKSEDDSAPAITTVTMPTPIYQTSSGQYSKCLFSGDVVNEALCSVFSCCRVSAVAITQGGAIQLANNGTDGVQGLQTLTMANTAAAQPGATILQYAQTSDGQQILVPSNQVVVQGGNSSTALCPVQLSKVANLHVCVCVCLQQRPPAMSRPIKSAQPPPAPSLPGW